MSSWYNLGNNTFVCRDAKPSCRPVAACASTADDTLTIFITARGQIVTTTDFFDFVLKRASKVRFWISVLLVQGFDDFCGRLVFECPAATTDRATATPAVFGDFPSST